MEIIRLVHSVGALLALAASINGLEAHHAEHSVETLRIETMRALDLARGSELEDILFTEGWSLQELKDAIASASMLLLETQSEDEMIRAMLGLSPREAGVLAEVADPTPAGPWVLVYRDLFLDVELVGTHGIHEAVHLVCHCNDNDIFTRLSRHGLVRRRRDATIEISLFIRDSIDTVHHPSIVVEAGPLEEEAGALTGKSQSPPESSTAEVGEGAWDLRRQRSWWAKRRTRKVTRRRDRSQRLRGRKPI